MDANHGTWVPANESNDREVIDMKWVFKRKYNVDGRLLKHKVRLVAQRFGFEEAFSPIPRYETLRMLFALSAHYKWPIYQLDVKGALLMGDMEEVVYASQPEGDVVAEGMEGKVCKLNKALYGLKQAPRAWFARLASFFEKSGFERSRDQPTLYIKKAGSEKGGKKKGGDNSLLLVCVYADDVIYMGSSDSVVSEFKKRMMTKFEMEDLGLLHSFLGLEIKQCEDGVFVSQRKYAQGLLKHFNVTSSNAAITPMNVDKDLELDGDANKADVSSFGTLVSGLMYLTNTRPDIAFAVGVVTRFGADPRMRHFRAAKRILRYIAGTQDFGIWYSNGAQFKLSGFSDGDWVGSLDGRRSTSGFAFNFGSGAVTWSSITQGVAAHSTTEAEYMAAKSSACQAMWLRRLLADLNHKQKEATEIFTDNAAITTNSFLDGRTEYIDNQVCLIRGLVSDGFISLKLCNSDEQIAEIFTKPLPSEKHIKFRTRLGVCKYESRGRVE